MKQIALSLLLAALLLISQTHCSINSNNGAGNPSGSNGPSTGSSPFGSSSNSRRNSLIGGNQPSLSASTSQTRPRLLLTAPTSAPNLPGMRNPATTDTRHSHFQNSHTASIRDLQRANSFTDIDRISSSRVDARGQPLSDKPKNTLLFGSNPEITQSFQKGSHLPMTQGRGPNTKQNYFESSKKFPQVTTDNRNGESKISFGKATAAMDKNTKGELLPVHFEGRGPRTNLPDSPKLFFQDGKPAGVFNNPTGKATLPTGSIPDKYATNYNPNRRNSMIVPSTSSLGTGSTNQTPRTGTSSRMPGTGTRSGALGAAMNSRTPGTSSSTSGNPGTSTSSRTPGTSSSTSGNPGTSTSSRTPGTSSSFRIPGPKQNSNSQTQGNPSNSRTTGTSSGNQGTSLNSRASGTSSGSQGTSLNSQTPSTNSNSRNTGPNLNSRTTGSTFNSRNSGSSSNTRNTGSSSSTRNTGLNSSSRNTGSSSSSRNTGSSSNSRNRGGGQSRSNRGGSSRNPSRKA